MLKTEVSATERRYGYAPLLLTLLLSVPAFTAHADDNSRMLSNQPQPPDVRLGPLFNAVQQAKFYPDQKTFADALPKYDPSSILADWQMQKNQGSFDLKRFVTANFTLPPEMEKYVPPAGQNLRDHIDGLWPVLTRTAKSAGQYDSLLQLPKPYVVPGGRFREIYYWDSYFTMLGLAESGHWDRVQDMVDNFASLLDRYGHIPNGNRSYYLSRSQPPFFSLMVDLLATHDGGKAYTRYLPQLQKEYDYWMADSNTVAAGNASKRVIKLADGTLLNRYWDARDVPRTESWMDDINTAKKRRSVIKRSSIANCVQAQLRAGILARAGLPMRKIWPRFAPPKWHRSTSTACCSTSKKCCRKAISSISRTIWRSSMPIAPRSVRQQSTVICGTASKAGTPIMTGRKSRYIHS